MLQMGMGTESRSVLTEQSTEQQKIIRQGMKQFYMYTTKYLIGHLLVDNNRLRDIAVLNPRLGDHGVQSVRRLAVMMPMFSVGGRSCFSYR